MKRLLCRLYCLSYRIFRIKFITLSLPQDAYTVSPSCSAAGGLNASIQRVLSVLKGRRKKLLAPKKDGGNWAQRGSSRLSEFILLTMPNYASSFAMELEKLYANDRSQLLVKQTCLLRITVADPGGSPLFLDQTEARRAEERFFGDRPPPRPHPPQFFSRYGSGTALYQIIRFSLLQVCPSAPPFVLSVLFTPLCHLLRGYFYVSLSLVAFLVFESW